MQALQSIVSRNVDPLMSGVLSVTQMNVGSANNVIAHTGELIGTVRAFQPDIRSMMLARLSEIVHNTSKAFGATAEIRFIDGYPPTINHGENVKFAASIAAELVGDENVSVDATPSMGAEDFAFILERCKGAYLYIGNGDSAKLHHQSFDFNDEISPIGSSYFVRLVEGSQPI